MPIGACVPRRLLPASGLFVRHSAAAAKPIMNRLITQDPLRVTYSNEDGEKKSEIMSRSAALEFAKRRQLDLILIKADAEPPVCKVASHKLLVKAKVDKAREVQAKQKEIREIHIGANIDNHDLDIKLNKVKEFLSAGSEVKIAINSNRKLATKNPQAMDRTVLMVLERVEGLVSSIRQPAVKFAEFRKDFILSPKEENMVPAAEKKSKKKNLN